MLYKVIHTVLDTLFPPSCLVCKKIGEHLCETCVEQFNQNEAVCFFCKTNHVRTGVCSTCRKKFPLDDITWSWQFNNQKTKEIIYAFKFQHKRMLAPILAENILQSFNRIENFPANVITVPIPLHKKKLRARGYNQAELLAQHIPLPFENILERIKNTPPQGYSSSRNERFRHMEGAFVIKKKKTIQGKNIILIDDVATTGATLCEAAMTLKKGGAHTIYAAVLAHG